MLVCQTTYEGALISSRFGMGNWSRIILNYLCSSQQSLSIKSPNQTKCHWVCWLSVGFVLMDNLGPLENSNLCNYTLSYIMGRTGWYHNTFFTSIWCNKLLWKEVYLLPIRQFCFRLCIGCFYHSPFDKTGQKIHKYQEELKEEKTKMNKQKYLYHCSWVCRLLCLTQDISRLGNVPPTVWGTQLFTQPVL